MIIHGHHGFKRGIPFIQTLASLSVESLQSIHLSFVSDLCLFLPSGTTGLAALPVSWVSLTAESPEAMQPIFWDRARPAAHEVLAL